MTVRTVAAERWRTTPDPRGIGSPDVGSLVENTHAFPKWGGGLGTPQKVLHNLILILFVYDFIKGLCTFRVSSSWVSCKFRAN